MANSLEDIISNEDNKKIFIKHIFSHIMKNLNDAFGYCCRKKLTLNEYCPLARFGNSKNEATTFITVRMSELWENAIYDSIKEIFEETWTDTDNVKRWTTADGDIKIFDQIWEIKTSQAKNSFTGATHSSHKVRKYILANYIIDRDVRLKPQTDTIQGFIPKLAVYLLDLSKIKDDDIWKGKATHNSSFSSMFIKKEWVINKCVTPIWGSIDIGKETDKRRKNATIVHWSTKPLENNFSFDDVTNKIEDFKNKN